MYTRLKNKINLEVHSSASRVQPNMDVDMGDGLSDEEHQSMEEDTFQAGEEVPSDEELSTQAPTLDVQHADNLVWLAKVPMFLIERWQNARANATLGHMHEHKTFLALFLSPPLKHRD